MDNKRIVIFGGGTVYHIRPHFALCSPAYGNTARRLAELSRVIIPNMEVDLRLTKMAGGKYLETNDDIANDISKILEDDLTKVIIMTSAICDFTGIFTNDKITDKNQLNGKYGNRLKTTDYNNAKITLSPAEKIISNIRKARKDIFLVGFKTTSHHTEDMQYIAGLNLCKKSSCNLVFANDIISRTNMIITPEESRYHVSKDREESLIGLLEMIFYRTHLTFTRSTVVDGATIPWNSKDIPESLRTIVNYCIQSNAYKPFNGVTAGHFAFKQNDTTFLTSIRRTNFNKLSEIGLVKIVTDCPDTVLAYGAKPSVGGQSQRIVFRDHPDVDCIVHFHCPKKDTSIVPTVSQREFECGSHECGNNTSKGLKKFGNLYCVYLDNHGPNIVFNKNINAQEVIDFINDNFNLEEKTGGFVSIQSRLETSNTLDTAKNIL